MVTCKSPVAVMRAAHELGAQLFDEHAHRFSRRDFTLPQLFACLVLREHQKKSYRGIEALLRDCSDLRDAVGLTRAPDHNTICRAFTHLIKPARINRALDLTVAAARAKGLDVTGGSVKPAVLDSTCFESRHVSRHFEKRQRQTAKQERQKKGAQNERNEPDQPERRTRRRRRRPATVAHGETAAEAVDRDRLVVPPDPRRAGHHRHGVRPPALRVRRASPPRPLLFDAWRRAGIKVAAADAGYDSEANHEIARRDMGVRSIIPPDIGRPSDKPPTTRYRRLMRQRFDREADKDTYGQRWQVETVNSMIKRNLGSALRATTARRRSRELLLRCITHNLMVLEGTEP